MRRESETSPPASPGRRRALLLLLLGGGIVLVSVAILVWRDRPRAGLAGRPVPRVGEVVPAASSASGATPPGSAGVELVLPEEMVGRAQLAFGTVERQSLAESFRTPAIVEPNAYRETPVFPLVDGRIQKVEVQLGETVREGQILATIFSADLAEVQMKYLTVDANLQFHAGQADRFEKLARIGAVSQTELEEVVSRLREHHAEHASLRERMLLYGLTEAEVAALRGTAQVQANVPVHAPASGVITTREVNPGQVLGMRDRLFTITDLSTVWIIAAVHEEDFSRLRLGAAATIVSNALPGQSWSGRIGYIDPRLSPETRTARVRIEVPNPGQRLRLGMFVDVLLDTGSTQPTLVVPRAALQTRGTESVVFLPLGGGRFAVRPVLTGPAIGPLVPVLHGLREGETVVTEGSFFLKAEMGR
jgi:cobalt-zinc-cadmium efflux system membrane fusion protein